MVSVSTKALKYGDRLAKDVYTQRNNLLMTKDTVLTLRDIEILQAFMIKRVDIVDAKADAKADPKAEETAAAAKSDPPAAPVAKRPELPEAYADMIAFMKRLFATVRGGGTLSALDVRRRLESLLAHVDEYRLITFKPPQYKTDDYIYHHSVCVAMTAYLLARWCDFPRKDWFPVALAGLLHNIGVTGISPEILNKPSALAPDEMARMREHTVIGYSLLKPIAGLNNGVKLTALQHHERENGSGYPLGMASESIHPYAKIVAVADMYHAMSLERIYRSAVSPYLVLEELHAFSFGYLDPKIVHTLLNKVSVLALGTIVRLNDGRIGEIVFNQREYPTRPYVSVNGSIVNLAQEKSLYIDAILSERF